MYNKKSRKPLKIRLSGFFYCFVIATDDETQTAELHRSLTAADVL